MAKIIRKWENNEFIFGQDMQGNVFCKCKNCDKTGVIYRTFDLVRKEMQQFAKCTHCEFKKRIDNTSQKIVGLE